VQAENGLREMAGVGCHEHRTTPVPSTGTDGLEKGVKGEKPGCWNDLGPCSSHQPHSMGDTARVTGQCPCSSP